MSNYERTLQRRLTYAGLGSLALAPVLGPVGLLGALGIFAGKGLRFFKKQARDEYFSDENSDSSEIELSNESPETAIARKIPYEAVELLEKEAQEKVYRTSLDRGYALAQHLISLLPEGTLDDLHGVEVTLDRKTSGIFNQRQEYQLNISLKR